jgi:hypothetical protein
VGLDCRHYCRDRGGNAGVRLQQAEFDHGEHSALFEFYDHNWRRTAAACEDQSAGLDADTCEPGACKSGTRNAVAGRHSALASRTGVEPFAAGLQLAGGRLRILAHRLASQVIAFILG